MSFFRMQIFSSPGTPLYQSDVEPGLFRDFVRLGASNLLEQGIFKDRERYVARIVPHWTAQPQIGKPQLADISKLSALNGSFVDISFDESLQPDLPVRFLTMRWYSLDRPLVYQEDMGVASVFKNFIDIALGGLLKTKPLGEGTRLKVAVLARSEGLP